ncbi:MAG: hypothetical protein WDO18_18835 [Acidobacteriota bacterium]
MFRSLAVPVLVILLPLYGPLLPIMKRGDFYFGLDNLASSVQTVSTPALFYSPSPHVPGVFLAAFLALAYWLSHAYPWIVLAALLLGGVYMPVAVRGAAGVPLFSQSRPPC